MHAVALGHIADMEFQEVLAEQGIDLPPGSSPLDVVGELEKPAVFGRHNA